MTHEQLAETLHRIELGCGCKLGGGDLGSEEQAQDVYWEVLRTLPDDAIRHAACHVIAHTKTAGFPPVGALVQAAVDFIRRDELSWSEAWALVRKFHTDYSDQKAVLELIKLPPAVRTTVQRLGSPALRHGKIAVEVFREVYNEVITRERDELLQPPEAQYTTEDHKPQQAKMQEFRGLKPSR